MDSLYTSALADTATKQTLTHEGGVAFALDPWARLRRFLILGSDGGTFYVGARELGLENARVVEECVALDGERVVAEIVAVSEAGRAPKNEPSLLALAVVAARGELAAR